MTPKNYQLPRVLLASTLALVAAGLFLLPGGNGLAHILFELSIVGAAAAVAAFAYATMQPEPPVAFDVSLTPGVTWVQLSGDIVPEGVLDGPEPLLALAAEGEVPHPDTLKALVPYFADPNVGFVQSATLYDGTSGVADLYRAQAQMSDMFATARSTMGMAPLRGSGAVVSRQAAREAYHPGDTWRTLGMRMVALGYTGHFEQEAAMLAWAPEALPQAAALLKRDSAAALRTLWLTLRLPMQLPQRLQYLGVALGVLAAWAAAACAAVSAVSLVLFDAGPVILNSTGAWVGDTTILLAGVAAAYAWVKLTRTNPLYPLALSVSAAYRAAYDAAHAAATGPEAKRAWAATMHAYRTALAIVRAGGSAGTAPAGTPARS